MPLRLDRFTHRGEFTAAQGREQIVPYHHLITLPFSEVLLEQVGKPLKHGLPHVRPKRVTGNVWSVTHQVLIEPGGAYRADLLFDGER